MTMREGDFAREHEGETVGFGRVGFRRGRIQLKLWIAAEVSAVLLVGAMSPSALSLVTPVLGQWESSGSPVNPPTAPQPPSVPMPPPPTPEGVALDCVFNMTSFQPAAARAARLKWTVRPSDFKSGVAQRDLSERDEWEIQMAPDLWRPLTPKESGLWLAGHDARISLSFSRHGNLLVRLNLRSELSGLGVTAEARGTSESDYQDGVFGVQSEVSLGRGGQEFGRTELTLICRSR